ncbi:MAG: HlyD family type I secretion periplasmic adaptor subunit [Candidatus Pacebacteria bacterium]|nr:HlyD family type I secretion periplasmic adaptor subunit [Candidatus Paceibacterota bacterium]
MNSKFWPGAIFAASHRGFLPAALEVLETPPNPLGRAIAITLCLIAFLGLGWMTFGQVDIVAVANGKLISRLRTQVVQPFETASVAAVLVRPGQSVRAGDPLIQLDKTAALAERDRARSDSIAASLDVMRLSAFLDDKNKAPFVEIANAHEVDCLRAQAQLDNQITERAERIASLDQEVAQRRAERQSLKQTLAKIEKALPMVAERADIREKAAAFGNTSILAKLESEQLLVETKAELEITHSKIESVDAVIAGLNRKIAATNAQIRASALSDLGKANDRAAAANEALAKAQRRLALLTLRAPIDGKVQQLHVEAAGSVVAPAQQLLSIAPENDQVEIDAVLENRDVGFVAVGQDVDIKVDAFPFTRYGLLRGRVLSIDRDAEATPMTQNVLQGSERVADRTDSVETSERLRYTVHIALYPGTLDIDGRAAHLLAGMSVKAEILTGKRRIIDFLLTPLRERFHDGLRER